MSYNIDGIYGLLISEGTNIHLITLDDEYYPDEEAIEDIVEEHEDEFEGLEDDEAVLVQIYHYDDYSSTDSEGDIEGVERIKFREIGSFESVDGESFWGLFDEDKDSLYDYILSALDEYGIKKLIEE